MHIYIYIQGVQWLYLLHSRDTHMHGVYWGEGKTYAWQGTRTACINAFLEAKADVSRSVQLVTNGRMRKIAKEPSNVVLTRPK